MIFNLEKSKTEPQAIVLYAICQTLRINREWLLYGTGEMEQPAEAAQRVTVLTQLQEAAEALSEEEQLFLLDVARALKKRLGRGKAE